MNNQFLLIFIVALSFMVFLAIFLLMSKIIKKQKKHDLILQSVSGTTIIRTEKNDKKTELQKKAEISRKLKDKTQEFEAKQKNQAGTLRSLLNQAGFATTSVAKYWLNSVIFDVLFFVFLKTIGFNIIAVCLFSFVGLFGIPRFYLKWKARRRQNAFLKDFPDALDAIVRLLRAGLPVAEAVAMCGREFKGPVAEEMQEIHENQKVGLSLSEAIARSADRIPITEMRMFATGIAIQSETGSSLSEVLTNLSKVIRGRFRLKHKIRALSSEAKSSAAIIAALPVLVGFGMNAMNPDYSIVLVTTLTGKILLWGCAIWMGIGVFVMKQMINFKV